MSGRGRGDDEGEDLPLYLEVCRFEKSLIVFIFGGGSGLFDARNVILALRASSIEHRSWYGLVSQFFNYEEGMERIERSYTYFTLFFPFTLGFRV